MANELTIPDKMPSDLVAMLRDLDRDYLPAGRPGYHPQAASWAQRLRAREKTTRDNPVPAMDWLTKLLAILPPKDGVPVKLMISAMTAVCGDLPSEIWSNQNLMGVMGKLRFSPTPADLLDVMEPLARKTRRLCRLLDILSIPPAQESAPYDIPPAPEAKAARAFAFDDVEFDDRGKVRSNEFPSARPVALSGKPLLDPIRSVEDQIRALNDGKIPVVKRKVQDGRGADLPQMRPDDESREVGDALPVHTLPPDPPVHDVRESATGGRIPDAKVTPLRRVRERAHADDAADMATRAEDHPRPQAAAAAALPA